MGTKEQGRNEYEGKEQEEKGAGMKSGKVGAGEGVGELRNMWRKEQKAEGARKKVVGAGTNMERENQGELRSWPDMSEPSFILVRCA